MSVTYLNYNANGTEITDEALVINTATAQALVHDHVISIEVWTGEGKTGSQLAASTDYTLGDYDSFYKTYNSITFVTHNGETVYCTYLTKGDKNSADDVNSKADKVASPTAGNFAALDANGNITDSGSKPADFNLYTHPNHSGDVTSVGDGATTIADDAVTNAKLADMTANALKANATASAANPTDLEIAANKFPARASTGNLEAKSITDFGLGLVAAADAAAGRTALGALSSANITQTISNGVTDKAPSEDAVYDALALKAPIASPTFTGISRANNPLFKTSYANATPIPYNLFSGQFLSAGFIVPGLNNYLYMAHIRHTVVLTNFTSPATSALFNGNYSDWSSNMVPVKVGDTDGVSTVSITFSGPIGAAYGYGVVYLWFYYEGASRPMPSAVRGRIKYGGNWTGYVNGTNYYTLYEITCYAIPFSNLYYSTTELEIEITNSSETGVCILSEIEYCKYNNFTFNPLMSKGTQNEIFGNQLFYNTSNTLTAGIYPATGGLNIAKIYPASDSTTALKLTKSNGTTSVMTVDTTNSRIGINKTPTEPLDVAGNIKSSGYLELNEITEPDAGAADTARLFLKDNGSGKTQLCVRFSSGATQVIATQP